MLRRPCFTCSTDTPERNTSCFVLTGTSNPSGAGQLVIRCSVLLHGSQLDWTCWVWDHPVQRTGAPGRVSVKPLEVLNQISGHFPAVFVEPESGPVGIKPNRTPEQLSVPTDFMCRDQRWTEQKSDHQSKKKKLLLTESC